MNGPRINRVRFVVLPCLCLTVCLRGSPKEFFHWSCYGSMGKQSNGILDAYFQILSLSANRRELLIVSGFTFCRNVEKLDYPFVESIRSLLPLVDEMIVNVGDSEDRTLELVRGINDPRIRVIESVWDKNNLREGLVYAEQTNIALSHCRPDADWAFYLQSDEILHENDYAGIRASMEKYRSDTSLLGLMFRYHHFVGDYFRTDPWAYRRALRIVRPGKVISVGDALGFARVEDKLFIGKHQKSLWRYADGRIYHYGWVKSKTLLRQKIQVQVDYYWDGRPEEKDVRILSAEDFMPEHYAFLKPFKGVHPRIMEKRISSFVSPPQERSRWLQPAFYRYVLQHGFKG